MKSSVVLRLFGERWLVDFSAYAESEERCAQVRALWGWALDDGDLEADRPVRVLRPRPAASTDFVTDELSEVWAPRVPDAMPESFPYGFSRALTRALISHLAGSDLLLHAAGVVSDDGDRAVVLVASSGTGKSTAARRLGQRWGYLSDELVRIDARYRVSGLPKPLSIIVSGFPGGKDEYSPDAAGLVRPAQLNPALAALVVLQRADEHAVAQLVPLTVHEVFQHVLPQSSSTWQVDRPLHRLAWAAERQGGAWALRYAEIDEAAPLVEQLLTEKMGGEPSGWVGHEPSVGEQWSDSVPDAPVPDAPVPSFVADDSVVARAPWTDAVELDGEVSVLVGPLLTRLAGIGASLWVACGVPRTVKQLTEYVVSLHGEHPDAEMLVRGALGDLAQQKLIVEATSSVRSG